MTPTERDQALNMLAQLRMVGETLTQAAAVMTKTLEVADALLTQAEVRIRTTPPRA